MSKTIEEILAPRPDALFGRVVSILEQARGHVVRAVNSNMVLAYWLIGREIVEAVQGGEERAAYGKKVIEDLSARLTERYGKGFSAPVLWSFRQFYVAYADRGAILFPPERESRLEGILSPAGRDLTASPHARPASGSLPQARAKYGKGFDERNLRHIRAFFQRFPKRDALRHELSWGHFRLLTHQES